MNVKVKDSNIKVLDYLLPASEDTCSIVVSFNDEQRDTLAAVNQGVHDLWDLGRQIMLNWCITNKGIEVLSVPYFLAPDILSKSYSWSNGNQKTTQPAMNLIKGSRLLTRESLHQLAKAIGIKPALIKLPYNLTDILVDNHFVDEIVKRYSISYVEDGAVALFDIVRFSVYDTFDQVTLLNSLAYSINSAHNKLVENGLSVKFARTTTGDGFYIWNRDNSIQGNINLYHLMHIVLANNAIAQIHSHGHTAPRLKAAFQIGQYYEYYQSESLQPTKYNYIVGDATVKLARMLEYALPGQILVGDFCSRLPRQKDGNRIMTEVDTVKFIDLLQGTLADLKGLVISDQEVDAIKCYLTGEKTGDDFLVSRYKVSDKHGFGHPVYNAKVNIYRENQNPIYLGLQDHNVNMTELERIPN